MISALGGPSMTRSVYGSTLELSKICIE
jgi:hypothetical protein